jgi:hypothetical protein
MQDWYRMLYYTLNGININHLFFVWTYLST